MFRSGGTATATATIGTADEMTPPSASAQVALGSAHDSAAAWRPPRSSGTTAAVSRAGSAIATKRKGRLRGRRRRKLEPGTSYRRQALFTLRGFAQPPRQFITGRPRENKNKLRSAPGLRRATGRGSSQAFTVFFGAGLAAEGGAGIAVAHCKGLARTR